MSHFLLANPTCVLPAAKGKSQLRPTWACVSSPRFLHSSADIAACECSRSGVESGHLSLSYKGVMQELGNSLYQAGWFEHGLEGQ